MLDLPRFAIMRHEVEGDYWQCSAVRASIEQAVDEYNRQQGKGTDGLYLVSLGFIAGPATLPIVLDQLKT
jgi:hypothetical protein